MNLLAKLDAIATCLLKWLALIIVIYFGFAFTAKATPPCYPMESSAKAFTIETQPQDKMTWALADDASFSVSWYCDMKYYWKSAGFVGWKRELIPTFLDEMRRLSHASHTDLDAAWNQYVTDPLVGPDDPKYGVLYPLIQRQYLLTEPVKILWQVKANGTQSSRPVFPVTSTGTRGTIAIAGARVAVDAPCVCATKVFEEPPNIYCDVTGQPNIAAIPVIPLTTSVALCTRRN